MIEKLNNLIKAYEQSEITYTSEETNNTIEDYKIFKKEEYIINLVLNKDVEYELVITIEQDNKIIYSSNSIKGDKDLYNKMINILENNKTIEEYVNEYYNLLLENVKTIKFR